MPHSLDALFAKISSQNTSKYSGPIEYIIVGLGNPGKEYENTRHNVGFMAVDMLAQKYGCRIDKLKFKSLCCDTVINSKRVLIMKPSTYMNLSGQAVTEAMQFYKIPIENVLVISDDISLDVGKLRCRRKGSDGGHNGLKNIIYLTGQNTFPRIKLGVGKKPNPEYNLADWVLSRFTDKELSELKNSLSAAVDAAELILQGKMDEAMNRHNS